MNFEELLRKIVNGDISIQEPMVIHNRQGDQNLHFMDYLHQYKNITKDNHLETLQFIMNLFRKQMNLLNRNESINQVITDTNNYWGNGNDFLGIFKNQLPEDFTNQKSLCNQKYNDSKEIIGLIGIDRMTNQTGDLNFGYWVKSSCQRKYIASRAIYATLMWLAKSYNAKVLEITVNPENLAGLATCKHILERLNLDQNPFGKTTLDLHGKNIEYYTFLIPLNKIEVDI